MPEVREVGGVFVIRPAYVRMRFRRRFHWIPREVLRLGYERARFRLECWYRPGVGIWPWRSWWCDEPHRPPLIYPFPAWAMKMKKRTPKSTTADIPESLASLVTTLMGKLPNIVAHCAVCRYDDGTVRQPGKLMISTLGAAWRVTLKDPDSRAELNTVGNTLDDALTLMELHAGDDNAPWEPDLWAQQKAAGKKK